MNVCQIQLLQVWKIINLNLMKQLPPVSVKELIERAETLAGKTLQHIATIQDRELPDHLATAKGMIGELIEDYLGASAGSLPEPDFQEIGVELKTIPINKDGKPKESTYVCVVSLLPDESAHWDTSLVKRKLSRVLWVPVEADRSIPLAMRRIGTPLLWSPTPQQEEILRQDWQELMNMVMTGELEQVSSSHGRYLQIRPKAQNARSLQSGVDTDGNIIKTLPRGFYLRTSFTHTILTTGYENHQ